MSSNPLQLNVCLALTRNAGIDDSIILDKRWIPEMIYK